MPDEIKGIAVLDDRGLERLMLCCVGDPAAGRKTEFACIPVRPRGTPESANPGSWEYSETGDSLHGNPSVLLTRHVPIAGQESEYPAVFQKEELFHSPGDWTIRFVRWSKLSAEERGNDEEGAYTLWRKLNAEYLENER